MNNAFNANAVADASSASDSLQRELEQCHRRISELARVESLLAGENRLLEMVAKSQPLPSILDGICHLVEAVSRRRQTHRPEHRSVWAGLLFQKAGHRLRHRG